MSSSLTITNLSCQYDGVTVLKSLDLHVAAGEIVCLLGASGCGKTTLLKAIAGLLPIDSGTLRLNGLCLDEGRHHIVPEQRNIGMIFQDYALFPHLTVGENIAFGLQKKTRSKQRLCVEQMLELVHLTGYQDRYPHQLSGGQQQRVAIARSLAYRPDLLLLDEPFSNIDTQVRQELIREIRAIFKAQGVTAIFVTHSREEAFAFADKMAVMNHGAVEQFGRASELYYHPSSRFVADFLGEGSFLPAKRVTEGRFQTALGVINAKLRSQSLSHQHYSLLLRPQNVILQSDPQNDIQIIEQQFMGDHCRYVVDVGGNRLIATSPEPLGVGDRVSVNVCGQGLYAFAG